ncbi:MAG: hypothetical protein L6R41_002164 [Letrouitia leprolyta]|nr:MAG: hypothetical protein L6R41_002164 [Letrouitia leprolyta]
MKLTELSIVLGLVAALPFSASLPAAEAEVFPRNTNAEEAVAAAAPNWDANFFDRGSCNNGGPTSYNQWYKPSGCTNIGFTPGSYRWNSRGAWKIILYTRTDCRDEKLEQGTNTNPVCQDTPLLGPFRSFKVVRA